jgi:hypothetical protein
MDSEQKKIIDGWQDELDAHRATLPAHSVGQSVVGHEFAIMENGSVEDAAVVRGLQEQGQDVLVHSSAGRQK